MQENKYFPTSFVATVENYPYGRLKCTAFFGTEFKKGKGFRSTKQTINPKNRRLNKPDKSTYSPILLMYQDAETGYFKHHGLNPNSEDGVNKCLDFVQKHYDLFTQEELTDIAAHLSIVAKAGLQALVIYCGAKEADVLEVGGEGLKGLIACIKTPTFENFGVRLETEKLDALKVPDFKPFTIRTY